MLRKTAKEIEQEVQKTRPMAKTKIKPIEVEYMLGGKKRKEIFKDKENLLWALKFQNPMFIKEIKNKYKEKFEIFGLGSSIEVNILSS